MGPAEVSLSGGCHTLRCGFIWLGLTASSEEAETTTHTHTHTQPLGSAAGSLAPPPTAGRREVVSDWFTCLVPLLYGRGLACTNNDKQILSRWPPLELARVTHLTLPDCGKPRVQILPLCPPAVFVVPPREPLSLLRHTPCLDSSFVPSPHQHC